MKRIVWIVLGICIAAAPMARADEWAKTYTISGKPELRVDTSDADILVDTWDKSTIEAHISSSRYKIGSSDLKLEEHQHGDTVQISLRFPSHAIMFNFGGSRQHVEITVHMPREGSMKLRTGDGHIQVASFKGAMELESGDGHQDLNSVDGNLRAHTGDGHIRVNGRFDNLELSTSDGSVDARVMNGSTMNSSWTVRTGDGSVTLDLPEHFAADLDMHTGDGHIRVDMPLAVEGHISERNIHGKLNGGGNTLTVHTGDGSINLQKS